MVTTCCIEAESYVTAGRVPLLSRAAQACLARPRWRCHRPSTFSDVEVVRVRRRRRTARAVPLTVLRRKGVALDGSNPTLLYGYGGYGVSVPPCVLGDAARVARAGRRLRRRQPARRRRVRRGWHRGREPDEEAERLRRLRGGREHLIERGVHQRRRTLAIVGGSNGGLLMGATLTQHPELFTRGRLARRHLRHAARASCSPTARSTCTEFGTVKDAEQFRAIYAYSPLHHVVDGTAYPAVMMFSGTNDPRVDPAHSRKFAARLQAANASRSSDPSADIRKRPRLWHVAQRGTRADRGSVRISLLAARDEGEHSVINGSRLRPDTTGAAERTRSS